MTYLTQLICRVFAACDAIVTHEGAAGRVRDDRGVVVEGGFVIGTIRAA